MGMHPMYQMMFLSILTYNARIKDQDIHRSGNKCKVGRCRERPGTECWSMAHQQAMITINEQSHNATAWQRFKRDGIVTERDLKYGRTKIVKLRMIHAYLVNDIRQPCTLVMKIVNVIPETQAPFQEVG
jgi:hypothetical protein